MDLVISLRLINLDNLVGQLYNLLILINKIKYESNVLTLEVYHQFLAELIVSLCRLKNQEVRLQNKQLYELYN